MHLPSFIPIIDLSQCKTHLWTRGIFPSHIIVSYEQIHDQKAINRLITLIENQNLAVILQLPSELYESLPLIPPSDIAQLTDLPLSGVMTGFSLDFRDYPKTVTWRAVERNLMQTQILLETLNCPVIVSLPGAFVNQMEYAVNVLSDMNVTYVAVRGGQYTFIKLHSRMNTFLDTIHDHKLAPLLYWDLWWMPSPLLRVKHFFGASWWQFGLHRFLFTRKRHETCVYHPPKPKLDTQLNFAKSKRKCLTTQEIVDQNYQYLVRSIQSRNKRINKI
jgi:hypothetical protein